MSIAHFVRAVSATLVVATLVGCAIVKETYMPDGSKGYSISCNGAAVGMNVCFEKAGELCGSSGYDLITREGQVVPFGVGSSSVHGTPSYVQGQSFATYGTFNAKSIMVKCRNHSGGRVNQ